ncbi:hypothetical protein BJF83_07445 [Nocardiopsis sp. CNR-923]|nr:hypothetical protein BJF83_07445 [Nocardiopsis sp. CNR-923]
MRPEEVRFVELHGTGTRAGDPVEARALGAVYGVGRDAPLLVGSVKTNIGHLEGAAGVAGLVKAALSVREGVLPASLNFTEPNPGIPLEELGLRVPTDATPVDDGAPPLGGVSSFGLGGTDCHVVVERAPEQPTPREDEGPGGAVPLVLSAASGPALRGQAARLRDHLELTGAEPRDVAYSLVTTRTVFAHRAVVRAGGPERARELLGALADGEVPEGVWVGEAVPDRVADGVRTDDGRGSRGGSRRWRRVGRDGRWRPRRWRRGAMGSLWGRSRTAPRWQATVAV